MSATPNADAEGVVSKVKVKKEIKTIVENLETILGDLKDVAKELKEVREQETQHLGDLHCTGLCDVMSQILVIYSSDHSSLRTWGTGAWKVYDHTGIRTYLHTLGCRKAHPPVHYTMSSLLTTKETF